LRGSRLYMIALRQWRGLMWLEVVEIWWEGDLWQRVVLRERRLIRSCPEAMGRCSNYSSGTRRSCCCCCPEAVERSAVADQRHAAGSCPEAVECAGMADQRDAACSCPKAVECSGMAGYCCPLASRRGIMDYNEGKELGWRQGAYNNCIGH